jgi:hypothetical protein
MAISSKTQELSVQPNMSVSLQTVFASDAHLAEGQDLCEEPTATRGKCLKFREGTRMPTVSSKKEQNLYLL